MQRNRYILLLILGVALFQAASAQIRVMPLGDSITEGWSLDASINMTGVPQPGYRLPLWTILTAKGYNVDFVGPRFGAFHGVPDIPGYDQNHAGYSSAFAEQFLSDAAINENDPPSAQTLATDHQPDIVLLMVGINDIGWQGGADAVPETISEIGQIIDQLRAARPNVTILLASVVPSNFTTDGRRYNEYPALNAQIPGLATSKNQANSPVVFVDMQTDFRRFDDNSLWFYMQPDLLHPNDNGDVEIANRWFQALEPFLGDPMGTLTSPANGDAYSLGQTVPVRIAASDPDSITAVTVFIDGEATQFFTAPPYEFNFPLTRSGPVTINALVQDATGREQFTAPATINVGAGGTAFNGMSAWYRADTGVVRNPAGSVSEWRDQSGNDHHLRPMLGPAPSYNATAFDGRAGLLFNPFVGTTLVSWTGMPRGDYTKVAVVRLESHSPNNIISSATSQYGAHAMWYGGDTAPELYHHHADFAKSRFATSSRTTPLNTSTVLIGTYNRATGLGEMFQDGVLAASGSVDVENTTSSLQIGNYATENAYFHGSIAEILIYPRVLSSGERSAIGDYLDRKYRSANTAPAFVAIPAPAVHLGESIGFTVAATDPDPGQSLTYTLTAPDLPGAAVNPVTGAFTWTPTATGGYSGVVTVTDNGIPSATDNAILDIFVGSDLRIMDVTADSVTWNGFAGRAYALEATTNLVNPTWTPVVSFTAADNNPSAALSETAPFQIWRVRVAP